MGSINLDMIIQTKELPRAGETVAGGVFSTLPGGKGANVAVAAARLGPDVSLLAAIGDDSFSNDALISLKNVGVDLSRLTTIKGSPTGVAFINVSQTGENQIAVASGANNALTPAHLAPIKADALITQFEISLATIKAAVEPFEGLTVINASPVTDGLEALLPHADVIIVNEGEYKAYQSVLAGYKGLIAMTLGARGAQLIMGSQIIAACAPPPVTVIDSTGAGDAFAAALTVALIEGQAYQDALDFACAVGALTTTQLGTQSASPSRADVDQILGRPPA